jgi:hypothetical protein
MEKEELCVQRYLPNGDFGRHYVLKREFLNDDVTPYATAKMLIQDT